MGCGSSKLEAPSIIHSWLTQRGTNTIDRRGFSEDQLLSPLEVTSPTAVDSPSKSMSDDDHRKEGGDEVEDKEDSKISTTEGGEEKDNDDNIVKEEDDDKGEDSIRHCGTSPSFRVYCLDNDNDYDNDEEEDKDGGNINSHPSGTARMVVTQQELDNSSVGETSGRKEGKRSRGRKLIQKDMFRGAGKNLRHLKLPHRRSASTDSHYQVELNDPIDQPQSTSQDHDQADESSHRQRRRHKLPLRLPHRNSTGSSHDTQSDDQSEDGNHRHRHLKLPHFARRGSGHEEGSSHSARDDTSSQDNQSECSDRRRRHLKLPHLSRHGSGHGDGGNRRAQPQTNSHDDDQNNHRPRLSRQNSSHEDGSECRSSCDGGNNSCARIAT